MFCGKYDQKISAVTLCEKKDCINCTYLNNRSKEPERQTVVAIEEIEEEEETMDLE